MLILNGWFRRSRFGILRIRTTWFNTLSATVSSNSWVKLTNQESAVGVPHEPTGIYVNPICLQLDNLILAADSQEGVLRILVTHRGALFLHNIITALSVLGRMRKHAVPFEKTKRMKLPDELQNIENDILLDDPRLALLISDLIESSDKLDIKSIEMILMSLHELNHCHYRLIGSLLKRLYQLDLDHEALGVAISIGQVLQWGGFGKAETFFRRLSSLLTEEASTIDRSCLMNSLVLYSKLPCCHIETLDALCLSLQRNLSSLTCSQLGIAAIAASEFGEAVPNSQETLKLLAGEVGRRAESIEIRDSVRVAVGLRRTNVESPEFIKKVWSLAVNELKACVQTRERLDASVASISDMATMVDAAAHFGLCKVEDLRQVILPYIVDHIDLVTEESAIKLLFGLSSAPESITLAHAPAVSLLIRKVGAATDSWERSKSKLMSIFFSQVMEFDFVDSHFRKFILDSSLAHWLMARRGYGVPYPETSAPLYQAVREALEPSVKCLFNEWIPNSPFNADILFPDERIAVVVLSRFSDCGSPVGTDLIQVNLIKRLGWQVLALHRKRVIAQPQLLQRTVLDQLLLIDK
jgi:hypothetical protein